MFGTHRLVASKVRPCQSNFVMINLINPNFLEYDSTLSTAEETSCNPSDYVDEKVTYHSWSGHFNDTVAEHDAESLQGEAKFTAIHVDDVIIVN